MVISFLPFVSKITNIAITVMFVGMIWVLVDKIDSNIVRIVVKVITAGFVGKICVRPEPVNKLSQDERKLILKMMNSEEFASKTPCEIVPILADRGIYLGSESTFYKVLSEAEMLVHRGSTHKPKKRPISTHKATAPDEVWMYPEGINGTSHI